MLDLFDYTFPENGLMAFKDGKQIASTVRAPVCLLPVRICAGERRE